jgi:hypothetical protein
MVEIKDWLGSLRRNNGREREMSYGLFLVELNIWKEEVTIGGQTNGYLYSLGPNY